MGKKTYLLLLLILILVFSWGCAEVDTGLEPALESSEPTPKIYETEHKRDDVSSRVFDIYKAETDYAIYEFEIDDDINIEKCQDTIQDTDNLIDSIVSYRKELYSVKPIIIIANYDIQTGARIIEPYFIDNTVIASYDMLNSSDFASCIIGAMSNISDIWILYGISGSVLNVDTKDDELEIYYSDSENLKQLDFFGARFLRSINGDDSTYAKETAISLFCFIESKYGIDRIISFDSPYSINVTVAMKNEWLDSIGISHKYDSIYDGIFNGYSFVKNAAYDLVVNSPFAEYRIIMQDSSDYLLSSVDNLELFLYKNLMGVSELKEILGGSTYSDQLNSSKIIIYDLNESAYPQALITDREDCIIYLNAPYIEYAHIHETVHFMFPYEGEVENVDLFITLQEGLACYLTSTVTNYYSCHQMDTRNQQSFDANYNALASIHYNDSNGETFKDYYADSDILESSLISYYLSHEGQLDTLEDFDRSLYSHALAYAILKTYDDELEKEYRYPLYESFVTYLVDTYSLNHVIQANLDCDQLENIFGKSEDVLFSEWQTYLLED